MNNSTQNHSIYTSFIQSKTGLEIPVFIDNMTFESKYNPEKEADSIISNIQNFYSFFIVTGLGSGILLKKLSNKYVNSKIIVVENSADDFYFLSSLRIYDELKKNQNIIFSTLSTIHQDLLNNYLPALYGDIKIIERPAWLNHIDSNYLKNQITQALEKISSDFSVQCHFGKIWQRNIVHNTKLINYFKSYVDSEKKSENFNILHNKLDISKKVYIFAAGPSLDNEILKLIENNELQNSYIIATDTAFSILSRYKVKSDFVISIDGQLISQNHFLSENESFYENTIFLFDFCSNTSAIQKVLKNKGKIYLFNSGHPLSRFLNPDSINLYSGSGTVTITAVDFAVSLGFNRIYIAGADFGFYNRKPYAKGSYFEELYSLNSNHVFNSESNYVKLFFRTELYKNNDKLTTLVLKSYEDSFINYLESKNLKYTKEGFTYNIDCSGDFTNKTLLDEISYLKFLKFEHKNINVSDFYSDSKSGDSISENRNLSLQDLKIALLPYIAYLRFHINDKTLTLEEYLNKAHKDLLRLLVHEK